MINDELLLKYNIKDCKFLTWDVETEGLNLTSSRPWEIAWNVYHGNQLVEEHQYYLKWPNLVVSEGAAKVTGFQMSNIEKYGREPKEVIDLFDNYLYNKEYKIVTANGLGFDVYIHNLSRLLLGYKTDYSYIRKMYDTNSLSKAYKLGIKVPEDKSKFLPFQYSMSSIIKKGLKTSNSVMAKEFGFEVDESKKHQAAYDISMTQFVLMELSKKMDIQ